MKKAIGSAAIVLITVILVVLICPKIVEKKSVIENDYPHQIYAVADSDVGLKEIPEDGKVGTNFTSHLPLVILDLNGQQLPDIYQFTEDGMGKQYTSTGKNNPDPWVSMNMKIIDNTNGNNKICDLPSLENNGKIKLRGMSSRTFTKKQYAIKLMQDGEELESEVLGMAADEDWILSNSIIDSSGIRNYLALSIGSKILPYVPDVRFCEVIIKDGEEYNYLGLYLMMEKIKKSPDRVDIYDYEPDTKLNYIVCRDRYNAEKYNLSTYATQKGLTYGYFNLVYPNESVVSDKDIKKIENEISEVEKSLYGSDIDDFFNYKTYLNVDSFVDYFIVNEFFMNYDAGINSTYYYKDRHGKIAIGPLWDYDNCLDNYNTMMSDYDITVFEQRPWFDKLITDSEFQERINDRYLELRKTVLSEKYIYNFIDETMKYLGNASLRNDSRWRGDYEEKYKLQVVEDNKGFAIDRNTNTPLEEATRIKDIIRIHGRWMDKEMDDYLSKKINKNVDTARTKYYSWIIVIAIVGFICMIIIVDRKAKGIY